MGNEKLAPEDGGYPNKKIQPPAGRDTITLIQMQSLLSAVNAYMAFLSNANFEQEHSPHKGPIDGGVKMAAENTFVKLCNRVDAMMDDDSRWNMEAQIDLEQSLMILYADQRAFIKHQREAVALMKSPHNRFKPLLVKLDNGSWAAFYGDPANEAASIVGVGGCPEEALANFDDVFSGKNYEQNKQTMDGKGSGLPAEQLRKNNGKTTGGAPRAKRPLRNKKDRSNPNTSGDPGASA